MSHPLGRRVRRILAVALVPVLLPLAAMADTDDDIAASLAAEESTSSRIADLELEIAELSAFTTQAETDAAIAGEAYLVAEEALLDAQEASRQAQEDVEAAQAEIDEAAGRLGEVARGFYQGGSSSLSGVAPYLGSSSLEDSLDSATYLEQLGSRNEADLASYEALEDVLTVLQQRADEATAAEQEAADAVEAAFLDAEARAAAAAEAEASAASEREALIVQLAAQRQTTVELETQRQDELEAAAQARAEQQAQEQALAAAPAPAAPASPAAPAAPATPAAPTPEAAAAPAPSTPATPTPSTPTAPATPPPTPATPPPPPPPPPAPEPAEPAYVVSPASGTYYASTTMNVRSGPGTSYGTVGSLSRHQTVQVTGTANGWFQIGDGRWASGSYLKAGSPPAAPPPPPPPSTPSAPSGSLESAISYAMGQVGDRYVLGANGPDAWDCSSLTRGAFAQVGISLPRTSSSQYSAGTLVPLSQARRGDLMFWSSNGRQSGIYHVAIYLGDGQKVHARAPGWGVQHDSVYYSNIMPNVVRLG